MAIVLPLVLLALQVRVLQDPPPYRRSQPTAIQRTGQNGYEEYSDAAQIALSAAYQTFEKYKPNESDPKNEATLLEAWQEQVRRFAPLADLVIQGNGKQVYDPKPRLTSSSSSTSPELAGFPGVADFFVRRAYVSLAEGDSAAAAKWYETSLQFVYRLDTGTKASGAAAAKSADRIYKGLVADLPKLGVHELDGLADSITAILAEDPTPINSLKSLRRGDVYFAEQALRDPQSAGEHASWLKALDDNGRVRTLKQFLADEDAFLQGVIDTAGQPEKVWDKVPFEENDPVAYHLASSSMASNIEVLKESAKMRTRFRILRLMARVYRYRWHFNKWPEKLAVAGKSGELNDPLSGGVFTYAATSSGFTIQSEGADWESPVTLEATSAAK